MPDYRLTPDEVETVAEYLDSLRDRTTSGTFQPESPSPFARAKAAQLLADRLACLGCHVLHGAGGSLAPDLGLAGERLQPSYLAGVIRDPARLTGGAWMPREPMSEERVRLLASYLAAPEPHTVSASASYLSPGELPPHPDPSDSSGAALYARYCAACHGISGEGNGFNARFLPVPPTRHADSAAMSRRPDDTLYDGIHGGGRILGRSHRMPGFGHVLPPEAIGRLVDHLRALCRCAGPAWSHDPVSPAP